MGFFDNGLGSLDAWGAPADVNSAIDAALSGAQSSPSAGVASSAGASQWSQLGQGLGNIGLGYLSGLSQVSVAKKAATGVPVVLPSQQAVIGGGQVLPGGQRAATVLNLDALFPFLIVAGIAYALARG